MAFFREYVCTSVALWRANSSTTVLAACAISQLDILAEVVAIAEVGGDPKKVNARQFRDELGEREPALKRVRNAHDSHKHGQLFRSNAVEITQGQRPYPSRGTGFFADVSSEGHFLGELTTSILSDDGMPIDVNTVLTDAMAAWERELRRLGYWIESDPA